LFQRFAWCDVTPSTLWDLLRLTAIDRRDARVADTVDLQQ